MSQQYLRKELTALSPNELNRFLIALNDMKNGPEWPHLMALHGGGHTEPSIEDVVNVAAPQNASNWERHIFCAHKVRTFLIWHRPYVAEFEFVLQTYDPESKGHDQVDSLALPYWNWDNGFAALPQRLQQPTVTLTTATGPITIPNPLLSGEAVAFDSSRDPAGQTTRNVTAMGTMLTNISKALAHSNYLAVAYRHGLAFNLEYPHDTLHGSVGGSMGSPPSASWDPIFWMHHCNVERHQWLWINAHPDPAKMPTSIASTPLWPFLPRSHFATQRSWEHNGNLGATTMREWWDNAKLAYTYQLPAPSPPAPAPPPPDAATALRIGKPHERIVRLSGLHDPPSSATLQVYVWKAAQGDVLPADTAPVAEQYIFVSGTDVECDTCDTERNRRLNVSVYVTQGLIEADIKVGDEVRFAARWVVGNGRMIDAVFVDAKLAWEETPLLDSADSDALSDDMTKEDVELFARELGFETPRELQAAYAGRGAFAALVADGLWQQQSLELMLKPRCGVDGSKPPFSAAVVRKHIQVIYTVDSSRDALSAVAAGRAVAQALKQWETALKAHGVKLSAVVGKSDEEASVLFKWDFVDGPGTIVAWTRIGDRDGHATVYFDRWVRWTESLATRVAVHEIGHVFGLPHTNDANSVMYPFGAPDSVPKISAQEAEAIARRLSSTQSSQSTTQ